MRVKTFSEFIANNNEEEHTIDIRDDYSQSLKKANMGPDATLLLLKFLDEIETKNELKQNF